MLVLASTTLALVSLASATLLTLATNGGNLSLPSTWSPEQTPCVADDIVITAASSVVNSGRACAQSVTLQVGASLELSVGSTLELPAPGMPQPFWCSVATTYPVTPPVVQSALPTVVQMNATLNIALTPQNLDTAIAPHFLDTNGLPLTYSLAWASASTAVVGASQGAWLVFNGTTASGTPADGRLARTQSVYVATASNGVRNSTASTAQFQAVVNVGKRPPETGSLPMGQSVPWQSLPYNQPVSTASEFLTYNLSGLFTDPDGFPLNYTVTGAPNDPRDWEFDIVRLVPKGTAQKFGTWTITVTAVNNVSLASQPFTFTATVVSTSTQQCPNGANFHLSECVECELGYYGTTCTDVTTTCLQHGTLSGATNFTAVCVCSGNYTGTQCNVAPGASTAVPTSAADAAAGLGSTATIAIAAAAAAVGLAVIIVVTVVLARRGRSDKLAQKELDSIVSEGDASIPFSTLTKWAKVGDGEFGEVARAIWTVHGGVDVAVKQVRRNRASHAQIRELVEEGVMMKALSGGVMPSPFIVAYYGLCVDHAPDTYIVLEFCEGGSLLDRLREPRQGWILTIASLRSIAHDVAVGMTTLASKKLVHRDLAARNVFLAKKNDRIIGKVGDLGMARTVAGNVAKRADEKVPYRWCAPEIFAENKYTVKSDVWAFGVMYWEAMSGGRRPYDEFADNRLVCEKVLGGVVMPQPSRCADADYNLMLRCWERTLAARPSFTEILAILGALKDERDRVDGNDQPPTYQEYGGPVAAGASAYDVIPMKAFVKST